MASDRPSWFKRMFQARKSGPEALPRLRKRGRASESSQPQAPRLKVVPRRLESVVEDVKVCTRLAPARSWAYQLQHIDPKEVAACPADVVVIDTSPDGDWRSAFTPEQVQAMKGRPGWNAAPKKVIAYMSIGEAEEQRFYWRPDWVQNGRKTGKAPRWLHDLNDQGWHGNWKVRFWEPDWQRNICGEANCFLDRIIDQGFDGVYLDIIDAYDYWRSPDRGKGMRPTADEEMVTFVRRIAEHARVKRGKPDFAVIPQNGEGLLVYPQYRAFISAIGKEDILYDQDGQADDKRVKARPEKGNENREGVDDIMENLRHALADRIPILAVEYLLDRAEDRKKTTAALEKMGQLGLIPHFGARDLGKLSQTILPPASDPLVS